MCCWPGTHSSASFPEASYHVDVPVPFPLPCGLGSFTLAKH